MPSDDGGDLRNLWRKHWEGGGVCRTLIKIFEGRILCYISYANSLFGGVFFLLTRVEVKL